MAKKKLTRLEELKNARIETRREKRRAQYWDSINKNKIKQNGEETIKENADEN